MKISRLKVVAWGLAVFAAGTLLASAQDETPSADAGLFTMDFTLGEDAQFIDVFGLPTPDEGFGDDLTSAEVTESTIYTDGQGKISGYALLSLETAAGTHSDVVANIRGSLGTRGSKPQARLGITGRGSSAQDTLSGRANLRLTFVGTAETTTTPETLVTNPVEHVDCTNIVQASNCTSVTTTYVAITNGADATNVAGTTLVTNAPQVTYYATNTVNTSDNTNVTTSSVAVPNVGFAWFTVATNAVNLCVTNSATTNCTFYTNIIYTAVSSSNATVFTSTVSTTNNSSYVATNTSGTTVTNATLIAGSFIFRASSTTNSAAPCFTPSTNSVITRTTTFTAVTNTADLSNTNATFVTNSTTLAGTTNVYVQTNFVSTATNGGVPTVVFSTGASAVVSNTFTFTFTSGTGTNTVTNTVAAFRSTSSSITNFIALPLLITNCVTNIDFVVTTNPPTSQTEVVGTFSGTFKTGIRGEKAIKFKNVDARITGDDNVTVNVDSAVSSSVVFLVGKKNTSLDVASKIAVEGPSRSVLPFIGSGSASSNNKFTLKLKGVAEAKNSNLNIKGTSSGTVADQDINIDGASVSGKILGQKIKSTIAQ